MTTLISEPQRRFITNLLDDRLVTLGFDSLEAAVDAMRLDSLEKRDASTIIERLKSMPKDPDPTMPAVVAQSPRSGRGNRPGKCSACHHVVGQGAGFYYLGGDGRWHVHHKVDECSTEAPPAEVKVEPGIYVVGEQFILVYTTRNNRLAGKVYDGSRFVYTTGAAALASSGRRISAEEAAAFGHTTGNCVFCMQPLTDGRSTTVGYGPVCATKNNLPWGDK